MPTDCAIVAKAGLSQKDRQRLHATMTPGSVPVGPQHGGHSTPSAPSLGFPKTSDMGTRKNNMDFDFVLV